MSENNKNIREYLQSVTDALSGHPAKVRTAEEGLSPAAPKAEAEAAHLRKVWEMLEVLSPPEPDDVLMEQLFKRVMALLEGRELADDDLDLVVGAAREPEPDDTNDNGKNKR